MYKGFRSGFSLLAVFALGSTRKQQKWQLAVSEDVVSRTHSLSQCQGLMSLCCADTRVFTALVLIPTVQIHGAAPHTGTCERMETVHVGRNRSGRWEHLRLAWLLEKMLE